jgi:Putative zinc-finger
VANEWNKTASVEFETMLRRHLRSGAAPVAACAGFDLDAASEYLEGALDEWRRASYESHLAGCAICRRHLIELARLAQAAPGFEAQPAVAPDRIPAWDRWKEVVAGWFDLSAWNLKWKIAGASGVAFTILIAALGARSWLYTYNHAELAFGGASATSTPSAESAALPLSSPTPELPAPYADAQGTQDLAVNSPARREVPPPAPSVGPVADAPKVAFDASGAARALIENQPPAAPVPANENRPTAAEQNAQRLSGRLEALSAVANAAPRGAETRQSLPPQTRGGAFGQINEFPKGGDLVLDVGPAPKARAANETAGGPDISHPRFRGDLPGIKPEPPSELASKPISQQALERLRKMLTRSPLGKMGFNSDSERKETPDTQESREDESANTLVLPWRWRGKVFRRGKGMWIDQEYKPEMQEWRLFVLPRGSEQYKRVLRDEPLLKEFFDKAPILIVWKNRIYKVLK